MKGTAVPRRATAASYPRPAGCAGPWAAREAVTAIFMHPVCFVWRNLNGPLRCARGSTQASRENEFAAHGYWLELLVHVEHLLDCYTRDLCVDVMRLA